MAAPLAAALFGTGVLSALFGTYWDAAWHTERGRDAFLSPPHLALYAGVALTGLALLAWAVSSSARLGWRRTLRQGPLALAGVGVAATLASAPLDDGWHRAFGRDAVVWSPPHLLAVASVLAIAAAPVLELARLRSPAGRRLLPVAGAALLAAATIPVLEYDTDVPQFGELWYLPVLAAGAALALGLVQSLAGRRWTASAAAAVHALLMAAVAAGLSALGLPGPALPLLLVPALALDLAGGRGWRLPARALAFTVALYAAYVPAVNWVRGGGQLGPAEVAVGLPVAFLAVLLALAAVAGWRPGRTLRRAALPAALLAVALTAPPALAHDPGQGEQVGQALLSGSVAGGRAAVDARLRVPFDCQGLSPRALVARRAGRAVRAPLHGAGSCRCAGAVGLPERGRWFVYVELAERDGTALEAWLPLQAGASPSRREEARPLYRPRRQPGTPLKALSGGLLYATAAALLAMIVVLARRSRPDPVAS